MPGTRVTLAERLERSTDRNGPTPFGRRDLGPCWLWTGHVREDGYAKIRLGGKQDGDDYVHRVSYGPVPDDMELDHLCKTRHCLNPGHLEVVTREVNAERRRSLVCGKRLHFMFGSNLGTRPVKGRADQRFCRACRSARGKLRYVGSLLCDSL
jgi:hypothetical protein